MPVPFPKAMTQGDDIDHVKLVNKVVRRNTELQFYYVFQTLTMFICSINYIALTEKISINIK